MFKEKALNKTQNDSPHKTSCVLSSVLHRGCVIDYQEYIFKKKGNSYHYGIVDSGDII